LKKHKEQKIKRGYPLLLVRVQKSPKTALWTFYHFICVFSRLSLSRMQRKFNFVLTSGLSYFLISSASFTSWFHHGVTFVICRRTESFLSTSTYPSSYTAVFFYNRYVCWEL